MRGKPQQPLCLVLIVVLLRVVSLNETLNMLNKLREEIQQLNQYLLVPDADLVFTQAVQVLAYRTNEPLDSVKV
jgi:hypothetical protein